MAPHEKVIKNLVNIGKRLDRTGFIIGEGGNISARVGGMIYIKRRAASMGTAKAVDYIPVDLKTGMPVRKKDRPSTEIYMHLACYRARRDIGAVIHTHPVFATALAIKRVVIMPATYEMQVNIKSPIAGIGHVSPGTPQLGRAVGKAALRHNAILLKNHGLVTVGRDLEEALLSTLAVERAALTYIAGRII